MIGPQHVAYFAEALKQLLGDPREGTVAFIRCLPSDQVDRLVDADGFDVPGWEIKAVIDAAGHRRITADQAVESREDKAAATLLMIDPHRAGAGLDGIYSAGREIGEAELFKYALELARKKMWGKAKFLNDALRRAERLGRRQRIAPWRVLDFTIAAATDGPGRAIARLGLWPIQGEGVPSEDELDISAALSERLLYATDTRSPSERVRGLMLDASTDQAQKLELRIRSLTGRSPEEAAQKIAEDADLWLGALQPSFGTKHLQAVSLSPWRDPKGRLLKWSGLGSPLEADETPRFVLDRDASGKERVKLTVRWTTQPEDLPAGALDYRVTIRAGDDDLAVKTVRHRDKPYQQTDFSIDDFPSDDFDGSEKFEAIVYVTPIGVDEVQASSSELFVIEFGQTEARLASTSGSIRRTLVEGAIGLSNRKAFDEAISGADALKRLSEDRKGYLIWKGQAGEKSVRVFRPALIRKIEEDWVRQEGAIGRWIQTVRADGTAVGEPSFEAITSEGADTPTVERVRDVCRRMSVDIGPFGLLGRVLAGRWKTADDYVNAWEKALDGDKPGLALHGTIEVRTQSGKPVGLLVTPLHPLRFAWHALYDHTLAHARFEDGMKVQEAIKAASVIDSSHVPFALPGTAGEPGFVFADVLGFHAVAMTVDGEPEPKAKVAVLSACLGGEARDVAPSIGAGSAAVLAREIRHYLDCHAAADGLWPELVSFQAWRPGDGLTVAKALGEVLRSDPRNTDEDVGSPLCFSLDIYHPEISSTSGRFFSTVGRRRRAGGQSLDLNDRWMTEAARRPGEVLVPRLRWAKRKEPGRDGWQGVAATHVGLAFDLFRTTLETRPAKSLADVRPLHAWGLVRIPERRHQPTDQLQWLSYHAPELTGETIPNNRVTADRLRRLEAATARATARGLGGSNEDWPVLVTSLPEEDQFLLERLHESNDWVITIDRHAAIDYFDAPNSQPDIYGRFVIDAVPERADLSSTQLVTSTTNVDAIQDLVDDALAEMGLSGSARNSRFLTDHLKALSGRLAIRLADGHSRTGELIALAMFHANCVESRGSGDPWLDLSEGFLVPIDEIADFAPLVSMSDNDSGSARRADFIYVRAQMKSGPMRFHFIEIKHRLHLRTARQPDLLDHIARQTSETRARWNGYFFDEQLQPMERAVRRSKLSRLLRFYLERARRHHLSDPAYQRLISEIDQLLLKDDYQPDVGEVPEVGFIFCPEHRTGSPEALHAAGDGEAQIWLFGPTILTKGPSGQLIERNRHLTIADSSASKPDDQGIPVEVKDPSPGIPESAELLSKGNGQSSASNKFGAEKTEGAAIHLGETQFGSSVDWSLSIRTNPHLMMVGLPGMGKTTALINICRQLSDAGVAPIVFSYHDDIDAKLTETLGEMRHVDFDGLGFNPLRVDAIGPRAHVDVAGTLRDIFSSIFPELGDLQLEELRGAILQSYTDLGWGVTGEGSSQTPQFQSFFDLLKGRPKPSQTLIARLQELNDYGFFSGATSAPGLLDTTQPTLIRIHQSTNEILQNAFSSFVLYSIYKDMFRRGVQSHLTHAIIFDEAHRAGKLKLIPRFAKECRKFGLAFTLASQGVRDFDPALFEAVGSYLILRTTDTDAKALARIAASGQDQQRIAGRIKELPPYSAYFFGPGSVKSVSVRLASA